MSLNDQLNGKIEELANRGEETLQTVFQEVFCDGGNGRSAGDGSNVFRGSFVGKE